MFVASNIYRVVSVTLSSVSRFPVVFDGKRRKAGNLLTEIFVRNSNCRTIVQGRLRFDTSTNEATVFSFVVEKGYNRIRAYRKRTGQRCFVRRMESFQFPRSVSNGFTCLISWRTARLTCTGDLRPPWKAIESPHGSREGT